MKKELVKIEAPEKIIFSYKIAETGTRIAAYIIDLIIQILVFIIIVLLILMVGVSFRSLFDSNVSSNAQNFSIAFLYIMVFFIQWGYYILFEVIMQGKSPGKMALGIRVIKSNGEPMDFATIVLRNLLRAVDSFPFLHLLGGFISIIDKNSRRLGDIVADTIVVHDIKLYRKEPDFSTNLSTASTTNDRPVLFKRLTENELFIVRKFLNGKEKLKHEKQHEIAKELAEKINKKLGLKENISDHIGFIEKIYRMHTYEDKE